MDPDLAVALGAAVQAGIFEGSVSNLMVMDVWQASLMRAYARQVQAEQAAGEAEEEALTAAGGDSGEWEEDLGEEAPEE